MHTQVEQAQRGTITPQMHEIVLSLGNTARSGCTHDRRYRMKLAEIRQNVQLANQARSAGVQVINEGAEVTSASIVSLLW